MGLIADTLGTAYVKEQVGTVIYNFHSITGILGLLLMFIHTVWATYIVIVSNPKQLSSFHKFSLLVWVVWLIPYFTGLISGMTR